MPAFANRNVVRITDARGSLAEDVRGRQRRYLVAMTFRVVAFVASVLLFHGVLRWIAAGVAMVLPWVAVVFANTGQDRRAAAPLQTVGPQRTAIRAGADADAEARSGGGTEPATGSRRGDEDAGQRADQESGSAVQDRTTAGS